MLNETAPSPAAKRFRRRNQKAEAMFPVAPAETTKAYTWFAGEVTRSQNEVTTQIIDLTPAIARVLLANNPSNRNISETKAAEYLRDIKGGAWSFNGQSIVVAKDGMLNDGQHRALAVAMSGVPIKTIIVFGVERDSRTTLDQGVIRTTGDYLTMLGFDGGKALGAMSRMVWQWRKFSQISRSTVMMPTKQELIALTEGFADSLTASLTAVSGYQINRGIGSRSMLAFCHFAFSTVAPKDDVDSFFNALLTGANLPAGSPILYARQRLLSDPDMKTPARVELIFRAFNLTRRGEQSINRIPLVGGDLPLVE